MENLKSMYNNMSDMSKMLIKILLGIIGAIIVLFILMLFVRMIRGNRKSYSSLENTIRSAAIKYYKDHENALPQNNQSVSISADKLVSGEYMKELSDYTRKNVSCRATVEVLNNNNYYEYLPILDCNKEHKTKTIKNAVLNDNKIVEESSGLYSVEDGYRFRGEFVNNYLSFANMNFRIIGVNSDGSVRLLLTQAIKTHKRTRWDDRYNIDKKHNVGINDYAVSRVRESLEKIYNDKEIFTNNSKALIVSQNLCVGSRSAASNDFSGTLECNKKLDNQYLGLIQANEYLLPSIDTNCNSTLSNSCLNYNYMSQIASSFWTQTPNEGDTYQVYKVMNGINIVKASNSANLLFTMNISGNAIVDSGDGSSDHPYTIRIYRELK